MYFGSFKSPHFSLLCTHVLVSPLVPSPHPSFLSLLHPSPLPFIAPSSAPVISPSLAASFCLCFISLLPSPSHITSSPSALSSAFVFGLLHSSPLLFTALFSAFSHVPPFCLHLISQSQILLSPPHIASFPSALLLL